MDALQLVAEPRRQEILRLVWDEERPVGDLVELLNLSYGGVPQPPGLLRAPESVPWRREGRRRLYRPAHAGLGPLKSFLNRSGPDSLNGLPSSPSRPSARERGRRDAPD